MTQPRPPPSQHSSASKPRPWSLRTQIAVVFGSLVALVAVLLSLVFGELLKWRIQQEAAASLHTVARNASKALANGLFERSWLAQVMASSPDLWKNGLNTPDVAALLQRLQATQPHSLWIGVADAHGIVQTDTNHLIEGQGVSDRPWFQAGLKDVYVGDVHPFERLEKMLPPNANGEPLRFVDFSAPIRQNDQPLGVLGIQSSWDWAREAIEDLRPVYADQTQIALFVFNRQGRLIYAPQGRLARFMALDQELPVTEDAGAGATDSMQAPGRAALAHWKDADTPFLTAVTSLPARSLASDLGWYVVARQPTLTAFAAANSVVYQALAGGIAAAMLAALIAWLAARPLSEDLNSLSQAALYIEAGMPGAVVPQTHSTREVQRLSSTLDHMTRRLLAMNEAMEETVRQRTLELQQVNLELSHQASSDPLTGLLNRRGFETQLAYALALARRSGRPLSVIAIDVDHFKRVNDTHGHEVGDNVLRSLGGQLKERLRSSDVLARLGGEEFIVLLPDTSLDRALETALQLLASVQAYPEPRVGRITVSAGLSALRADEEDASAMLRRSDEALYAAKAAGRNCAQVLA